MLVIGFFFPTSIDGIISANMVLLHYYILIFMLSALLVINKLNKRNILIVFSINIILLLATLIQPLVNNLERISWGSYLSFLSLSLIYLISFLEIKCIPLFKNLFALINILSIFLGILIVFNYNSIELFFITHYSMGYQDLLYNMFAFDKPVSVFGSHSIASFFYYLFFYISFQTFIHTKKRFSLLLAIGNLFLIVNLKSVSAYLLLAIAAIQISLYFFKKSNFLKLIALPATALAIIILVYSPKDNLIYAFSSQNNGFIGRYSSNGALADNIHYIANNLFPIGLWFSSELYFTDSGFVLNLLKGSIFLVIAIYLGLFILLKHNIRNKNIAHTIFGIICLFELGYPILNFTRTLYFMPFILIYMNNIKGKETSV